MSILEGSLAVNGYPTLVREANVLVGDKVLHMNYSTKAAGKSLRAHPYPLKKLVFSLHDEDFHESNTMDFEPKHVEVVFFDDLFVFNYMSGNLCYLRASCLSSLMLLNKAAVELFNELAVGGSHADFCCWVIILLVLTSMSMSSRPITAAFHDQG